MHRAGLIGQRFAKMQVGKRRGEQLELRGQRIGQFHEQFTVLAPSSWCPIVARCVQSAGDLRGRAAEYQADLNTGGQEQGSLSHLLSLESQGCTDTVVRAHAPVTGELVVCHHAVTGVLLAES